ncbi:MAG: hypothetical protein R6U19_05705 [Bacteroidales bacterium]
MKRNGLCVILIVFFFSCDNKEEKAFENYREGLRHLERNQEEKALAAFEKAIDYDDEQPEYFYHRANIFSNRQEYDKAMDDYRKTLRLDSTYYDAWANMGTTIFYQTGDKEKACPYWIKSHKLGKPNMENKIKHCPDFHPGMINH